MIGCLRTRVRKQPIIALYFESENELNLYNLKARMREIAAGPSDIVVELSRQQFIQMPPCSRILLLRLLVMTTSQLTGSKVSLPTFIRERE